jgi:hypothetical protein
MAPQADALADDAAADSVAWIAPKAVAWVAPKAVAAGITFFGESPPPVSPLG